MNFAGKVALVTGGGTGIGAGIAIALAKHGADVALSYHNSAAGALDTEQQIQALGRRCLVKQSDIRQVSACQDLVASTIATLGRLDILVNNSGVTLPVPFLELTEETWDTTVDINLKGMVFCSQFAARHMVQQGAGGRIINLSSVHGFAGRKDHAHYEATKGGINLLTKGMAIELAPYNITVNAIAPGAIEVERYFRTMPDYDRERVAKTIPLGRVAFPDEVGDLAVFLASDGAAYITGQTIIQDGGILSRL